MTARERVEAAAYETGVSPGHVRLQRMLDVLDKGYADMARQLDAVNAEFTRDHDLPTEPGAVIFMTGFRGVTPIPARQAMRMEDGTWVATGVDNHGRRVLWRPGAEQITDWVPARVVREDVFQAAEKALRDVVELLQGAVSEDAQEAQDTARRALEAIEGGTT